VRSAHGHHRKRDAKLALLEYKVRIESGFLGCAALRSQPLRGCVDLAVAFRVRAARAALHLSGLGPVNPIEYTVTVSRCSFRTGKLNSKAQLNSVILT
jgi:hypothetical protein